MLVPGLAGDFFVLPGELTLSQTSPGFYVSAVQAF